MSRSPFLFFIIVLSSSCHLTSAQDADLSVLSQVETDLSFADSLSIFNLIDSLLQNAEIEGSQLALRLTYNSNVLSTGRTLGIQNFGLAPGLSYYHKSGLYADLSGFWSKDFDPTYYLTIASLGYLKSFSDRFSLLAGYDRYFYNLGGDGYIPYSNALSISPSLDFKPVSLSASYSFYFGDATAHRIMPGITLTLEKKKFLTLERISINPAFFILFGDETITTLEYNPPKSPAEAVQNYRKYGSRFGIAIHDKSVFGIMNFAFSIPVLVSHKNWGFSFSYTYNIPKALPGEPLILSKSSYLSGSITYFIPLNRDKLAL
jgi:hypothetical protein